MNVISLFKTNKKFRSSVLTATLAVVAVISVVIAAFQVNAWFKSFTDATTDGTITNFTTSMQYSTDNGMTWHTLAPGMGIPYTLKSVNQNGSFTLQSNPSNIQIRVLYEGKSEAYLRVLLTGGFRNADTETYLPDLDGIFTISESTWKQEGDYWYYSDTLGDEHDESKPLHQYEKSHSAVFTVEVQTDTLSEDVSPHQDYQCELFVATDTVQPDRIDAFWGLETIPQ